MLSVNTNQSLYEPTDNSLCPLASTLQYESEVEYPVPIRDEHGHDFAQHNLPLEQKFRIR